MTALTTQQILGCQPIKIGYVPKADYLAKYFRATRMAAVGKSGKSTYDQI
jgi:hypothetical protein